MNTKHSVTLIAAIFLIAAAAAAQLPATYDLRDVDGHNYVTSVKNQIGGTCWTHGTMAAIESNLIMTHKWADADEPGWPNLAEYHLDWWNGFNDNNNDDIYPPWGSGLYVHEGGDYRVASAYLIRGEGAVRDLDGQSYNYPPLRDDPSYHKYYPREIEWYAVETDLSNIDVVKQAIIDYGAMGTCLCSSSGFISGSKHYQPPTSYIDPNHAVAIVGWDDNITTPAPLPGAWLCKNSWGDDWGLDGYFWISYYDKHCGHHPEMGAVSFQDVVPLPYDQIYYYDYHGWRATKTDCNEALNDFITTENIKLEAVGIFTAADNVSYTITIYDHFILVEGGVLFGELATVSGTIEHTGYHTIDLPTYVSLPEGDDFAVYVYLSDGGHAYDCTSDVPVLLGADYRTIVESSAEYDQSFYKTGEQWADLYNFNPTANFCIKALATIEPELSFRFPGDPPGVVPPAEEATIEVIITDSADVCITNTVELHYRYDDGEYQTLSMKDMSDHRYEVTLPPPFCDDTPEFYFSAQAQSAGLVTWPDDAPAETFSMSVGEYEIIFADDFDSDQGWTVENDMLITDGFWERGIPVGDSTGGAPMTAYGGSGYCFVTGNAAGDSDVDYGRTTLISPTFDMSAGSGEVIFKRWYCNNRGLAPYADAMYVYMSSNNGTNWMLIDIAGPEAEANGGWREFTINPATYLVLTDQMKLRIDVSDYNDASIVEAAIDDILVRRLVWTNPWICGDCNDDTEINILDIIFLINYKYKDGPEPEPFVSGDVNADGSINILDIVYLINYKYKEGPAPNCN